MVESNNQILQKMPYSISDDNNGQVPNKNEKENQSLQKELEKLQLYENVKFESNKAQQWPQQQQQFNYKSEQKFQANMQNGSQNKDIGLAKLEAQNINKSQVDQRMIMQSQPEYNNKLREQSQKCIKELGNNAGYNVLRIVHDEKSIKDACSNPSYIKSSVPKTEFDKQRSLVQQQNNGGQPNMMESSYKIPFEKSIKMKQERIDSNQKQNHPLPQAQEKDIEESKIKISYPASSSKNPRQDQIEEEKEEVKQPEQGYNLEPKQPSLAERLQVANRNIIAEQERKDREWRHRQYKNYKNDSFRKNPQEIRQEQRMKEQKSKDNKNSKGNKDNNNNKNNNRNENNINNNRGNQRNNRPIAPQQRDSVSVSGSVSEASVHGFDQFSHEDLIIGPEQQHRQNQEAIERQREQARNEGIPRQHNAHGNAMPVEHDIIWLPSNTNEHEPSDIITHEGNLTYLFLHGKDQNLNCSRAKLEQTANIAKLKRIFEDIDNEEEKILDAKERINSQISSYLEQKLPQPPKQN